LLGGCSWIIGEGDHHLRHDPVETDAASSDAAPSDAAAARPVLLAHDEGTPGILTTDGRTLFWIREAGSGNPGAILRVPRAGGQVSVVADGLQAPSGVRADTAYVYF